MTSRKSRAVLYIPAPQTRDVTSRCLRHCDAQGHVVVALINGNDDQSWRNAHAMLASGEADVLVISDADASHVEVAGEQRRSSAAGQRRPRRHP